MNGVETSAFVESGVVTNLDGTRVQVVAGVIASRLRRDAFTETGAGALALDAPKSVTDSTRAETGVRLSHRYAGTTGHSWTPHVEGRFFQELLNPESTFSATLAAAPQTPFSLENTAFGRRALTTSVRGRHDVGRSSRSLGRVQRAVRNGRARPCHFDRRRILNEGATPRVCGDDRA